MSIPLGKAKRPVEDLGSAARGEWSVVGTRRQMRLT